MHLKNTISLFLYFGAPHYFFVCDRDLLKIFNKLVLSPAAFNETAPKTLSQQTDLSYTSFSHLLQSVLSLIPFKSSKEVHQYLSRGPLPSHLTDQASEHSHGHCREFQY